MQFFKRRYSTFEQLRLVFRSTMLKNKRWIIWSSIYHLILLHQKLLQFDWLWAVVFHLNLKYLHMKATKPLRVVEYTNNSMICTYDIWLNVIFQSCLKFTISKCHSWYLMPSITTNHAILLNRRKWKRWKMFVVRMFLT